MRIFGDELGYTAGWFNLEFDPSNPAEIEYVRFLNNKFSQLKGCNAKIKKELFPNQLFFEFNSRIYRFESVLITLLSDFHINQGKVCSQKLSNFSKFIAISTFVHNHSMEENIFEIYVTPKFVEKPTDASYFIPTRRQGIAISCSNDSDLLVEFFGDLDIHNFDCILGLYTNNSQQNVSYDYDEQCIKISTNSFEQSINLMQKTFELLDDSYRVTFVEQSKILAQRKIVNFEGRYLEYEEDDQTFYIKLGPKDN